MHAEKYLVACLLLTVAGLTQVNSVFAQPLPSPEDLGVHFYRKPLQFEYIEKPVASSDRLDGLAFTRDPKTGQCIEFEIKNGKRGEKGEITDHFYCHGLNDEMKKPKESVR